MGDPVDHASGSALIGRLRASSAELAELVGPMRDGRHPPPVTSQDRRRTGQQVEATLATLAGLCDQLEVALTGGPPARGDPHGSLEPLATADAALAELTRQRDALEQANARLHAAAEAARAAGVSWRRIGEALGIAAQTAHKRFDPTARRRHAEYMRERYRRVAEVRPE